MNTQLSLLSCFLLLVLAPSVADAQTNLVAAENQKPGTTDWLLKDLSKGPKPPLYAPPDEPYDSGWRRRIELEGYCSRQSIRAGETLTIYVSTNPAARFRLDIYRMGYYGGKGGRLMKSFDSVQGIVQPTPDEGPLHIMECKWTPSVSFKIPDDWVSGVYLGKMSTVDTGYEGYVVFIVRDDRKADLLFQCSDNTWQAYNRWPKWHALYDLGKDPWGADAKHIGYDISFDRPYAIYWNGFPAGFEPLTKGSGEFLMTEFPLAYWLEREGYDVTYISNSDTHSDGKGLMRGKVFLSVGHDEYWTKQMYDNVTRARDAGVSVAFLSGNAVSGEVALNADQFGKPDREIRRLGDLPGEEKLMGATTYGVGFTDWICDNPDHWVFAGTGMKKGDHIAQLVGWEFHGPPLKDDPSLEILSQGHTYGWHGEYQERTYASTIYKCPKGNYVFDAATCWWNMVLSSPPGFMNPPKRYFWDEDHRVQQITRNVLNRMIEVSPAK